MRIARFSWETPRSQAVGEVAAHLTKLAAALERRGHEIHVFTRPRYPTEGVHQIDGVWYHFGPHTLNPSLVDEAQEMCRSFVCHWLQTEDDIGWGWGTLLTNFEWGRWMEAPGQRAAKTEFSWDRLAERTEECYRE